MAIDQNLVILSRRLRKEQTPWEKELWMHLKGSRFLGCKFKRQVVIGPCIYDFSCFKKKLIIELDGSEHKKPEITTKYNIKQQLVEKMGYKVLRFNNDDIINNIRGVLEKIRLTIKQ